MIRTPKGVVRRAASRGTRGGGRSSPERSAVDRHGRRVTVGRNVRVLEVTQTLRERLSPKEWAELQTMVGEVFTVYEIDEHGAAWVEKQWLNKKGRLSFSHSYTLDSHEMEVVAGRRAPRRL